MRKGYIKRRFYRLARLIGGKYLKIAETYQMWFSIIQTRVFLCLLVLAFTLLSNLPLTPALWLALASYVVINISLVFIPPPKMHSRSIRLIPDCVDILFISLLIWLQGDIDSIWFLFYLFPIISVARYQGLRGSLILAVLTILASVVLFCLLSVNWSKSLPPFLLRCMGFLGIAFIAGNLTKDRALSDQKLLEVLGEINKEIFQGRDLQIQRVYEVILKKAVEITNSRKGHIRRLTAGHRSEVVAKIGLSEEYEQQDFALSGYYSDQAIKTKKPILISLFTKKDIKDRLGNYLSPSYPPPRSALFVPLLAKGDDSQREVIAVIAVYTRRRAHYTNVDAVRLESFAPLLEIAEIEISEKNAKLYKSLREESEEKQNRLIMLHELAKLFENGDLSKPTLQEVADLVMRRLNSEEAAIFLWEPASSRIVKKAEASPSQDVTDKLLEVEKFYLEGKSVTGKCFATGLPEFDNDVPAETEFAEEYSKELPSKKVSHIMVTPLSIGKKKLGVLRVINKKASDYSLDHSNPRLDESGFSEDDKNLLRTIAINIAVALNSKDLLDEIETNRRYLERIINDSPYPIIVLDKKGIIKVFNHVCQAIWGIDSKDAVDKSVKYFYESEDEARRLGKLLRESPKGRIEDEEAKIVDAHGNVIPIRLSASLIKDDEGEPAGSIGVFKDLREIKRFEEQRLETGRVETIARVMGYVSHDVKNELAAAQVNINTLKKWNREGEKGKVNELLMDLETTLTVAVDKLTNIAMTRSTDVDLPKKELVYVEEIFDGCWGLLSRLAGDNKTKLIINNFPRNKYRLQADVEQLQMALKNLYDNSAHAIMVSNGLSKREIRITVEFDQNDVLIDWEDSGCGIPRSRLNDIFKSWFTTKDYGNGLGLYWVKNVVTKHKGSITVDSEEGKWTKFRLQLPLNTEEKQTD